jgi:hypothetical protein
MTTQSELSADYSCPFCPDHQDHEFIWHDLAVAYVCLGCYHEIDCSMDFEQQPTAADINCFDTIERMLARLEISYAEAKERQRKRLTSP